MLSKRKYQRTSKGKIQNGIKILVGISLLVLNVRMFSAPPFIPKYLTSLKVTVNKNIATFSGRYAKYGYSISADGYNARFVIDDCVNFICDRNRLLEIQTGDILEIKFGNNYSASLMESETEVPIYSLTLNEEKIFSSDDYLIGQRKQNIRLAVLISIGVIMVLLLSIEINRKRIAWIAFFIYVILALLLMELKII